MTPAARLQVLGAVRVGVGTAWALGLVARHPAAGGRLPVAGRVAAAALAVRDVAQGALLLTRPDPAAAEAGAVVDVLHGLSMLPVVALAPRYRLAATVSAAGAAGWVAAAVLAMAAPTTGRLSESGGGSPRRRPRRRRRLGG